MPETNGLRTPNERFSNIPTILADWADHKLKFMFSKKATKIDEIFTVDLTLSSKCQIDGEDFVNFHGLLRKQELYEVFMGILGDNTGSPPLTRFSDDTVF